MPSTVKQKYNNTSHKVDNPTRIFSYYFPEYLNGKYRYTSDLLKLDSFLSQTPTPHLPTFLCPIITPLQPSAWADELQSMPDKQLVQYLISGIKNGFRIGFDRSSSSLQSAVTNMPSARINPGPVQEFLTKELQAGRLLGPLRAQDSTMVHISRFGAIPKRFQKGKWRLILDLSAPTSRSVNDGINPELCSMSYSSVDQAAKIICSLGRGALMAKIDIAHAYRNVPVHPGDRLLLGMRWKEATYVDTVLPFGLRSAPKIFSALADSLEWILLHNNVSHILHYLDDFFTAGANESTQCARNLEIITRTCNKLGFPFASEKVEGPSTSLTFLGTLLDSAKMEMRLPPSKLHDLQNLISRWQNKKSSTKRELLSLIGHLSYATKVIPEGRAFLRRMLDLAASCHHLDRQVRLNATFKSDLMWWHLFLDRWHGVSCMRSHFLATPDATLYTDASGNWGCGAICFPLWFKYPWPPSWSSYSITIKELLPIVIAIAVWGHKWSQ